MFYFLILLTLSDKLLGVESFQLVEIFSILYLVNNRNYVFKVNREILFVFFLVSLFSLLSSVVYFDTASFLVAYIKIIKIPLFILVGYVVSKKETTKKVLDNLLYIAFAVAFLNILDSLNLVPPLSRHLIWFNEIPLPFNLDKTAAIIDTRGEFSSFVMSAFYFSSLTGQGYLIKSLTLVSIFFTGSRSSWIAVSFSILIYLLLMIKNKKLRYWILFILSTSSLFLFYKIYGIFMDIVSLRAGTFDDRIVKQVQAFEQFKSNNFLGVQYNKLTDLGGTWLHNGYLIYLFSYGIVSFLVLFIWVFKIILQPLFRNDNKMSVIALCSLFMVSVVEWLAYGQMFNPFSWFIFGIILVETSNK